MEFFRQSAFFGALLTLLSYELGIVIKKKLKLSFLHPMLISIVIIIAVLLVLGIDYDNYYSGAKYLNFFMTPSTVALAIPLYEQSAALKNNWKAILIGIASGVVTCMITIFALCAVLKLDHQMYVTLLPKSITTAIGMVISEEAGGISAITVGVIAITGIFGSIVGEHVMKLFRITDPVAKGIAYGTSSHAIGTAKALEVGEVEGAMSGLSMAVCGVMTVIVIPFVQNLI